MPQIIVRADRVSDRDDGAVMLRERVRPSDFESDHFQAQLVERLGWAVLDAHEVGPDRVEGELDALDRHALEPQSRITPAA